MAKECFAQLGRALPLCSLLLGVVAVGQLAREALAPRLLGAATKPLREGR